MWARTLGDLSNVLYDPPPLPPPHLILTGTLQFNTTKPNAFCFCVTHTKETQFTLIQCLVFIYPIILALATVSQVAFSIPESSRERALFSHELSESCDNFS